MWFSSGKCWTKIWKLPGFVWHLIWGSIAYASEIQDLIDYWRSDNNEVHCWTLPAVAAESLEGTLVAAQDRSEGCFEPKRPADWKPVSVRVGKVHLQKRVRRKNCISVDGKLLEAVTSQMWHLRSRHFGPTTGCGIAIPKLNPVTPVAWQRRAMRTTTKRARFAETPQKLVYCWIYIFHSCDYIYIYTPIHVYIDLFIYVFVLLSMYRYRYRYRYRFRYRYRYICVCVRVCVRVFIYVFIHSFIHVICLFIYSFVYLFICLLIYLLVYLCLKSFIFGCLYLLVHLFMYLFIYSFIHYLLVYWWI